MIVYALLTVAMQVAFANDGAPAEREAQGRSSEYFEMLIEHPQHWVSSDLRSQGAIDSWDKNRGGTYDSVRDAMRQTLGSNRVSMGQVRKVWPAPIEAGSGNLFVTWETLWEAGWAQGGPIDHTIKTYKAFQFASNDSRRKFGSIYLELRCLFSHAARGKVCQLDVRPYRDAPTGDTYGSGSLAKRRHSFNVSEEVWTRFFVFLDLANRQFTYWVADENHAPALLYDRVPHEYSEGLKAFWFEFNTSQKDRVGPERRIYNRNWVALRNLPGGFGDASALVAQGSFGARRDGPQRDGAAVRDDARSHTQYVDVARLPAQRGSE